MANHMQTYPTNMQVDECSYIDDEDGKTYSNVSQLHNSGLNEESLFDNDILDSSQLGEDDELQFSDDFKDDRRLVRARKRRRAVNGGDDVDNDIDYTATNYYHRYKNKPYVRRNDEGKYCQVCKAKRLGGRSRGLPSDLQLRKLWILRFNLEPERAAELWVKDAFADGTHTGEVCAMHFPDDPDFYRHPRDILPIDMRDPHLIGEDADDIDFGDMILTCVFCNAEKPLRSMIPFARARFRRRRWIAALSSNNAQVEDHLRLALKNGATKFLCDWHFADSCFAINSFGEWRLKKDALPNPRLDESKRSSTRIYMINHVDSNAQRNDELRRRRMNFLMLKNHALEKARLDRESMRTVMEKMRRTFPRVASSATEAKPVYEADRMPQSSNSGSVKRMLPVRGHPEFMDYDPEMPLLYPDEAVNESGLYHQAPTSSHAIFEDDYLDGMLEMNVDYSDESDAEMEIIKKVVSILLAEFGSTTDDRIPTRLEKKVAQRMAAILRDCATDEVDVESEVNLDSDVSDALEWDHFDSEMPCTSENIQEDMLFLAIVLLCV